MDIFDMFFGGGGGHGMGGMGGRHRGPRRTKNLMHQLSVSLEDMYNGTTRKLALQKNVICGDCDGELKTLNKLDLANVSTLLPANVGSGTIPQCVIITDVPTNIDALKMQKWLDEKHIRVSLVEKVESNNKTYHTFEVALFDAEHAKIVISIMSSWRVFDFETGKESKNNQERAFLSESHLFCQFIYPHEIFYVLF